MLMESNKKGGWNMKKMKSPKMKNNSDTFVIFNYTTFFTNKP